MKLTGRAVLFNYMLELDAVDVAVIDGLLTRVITEPGELSSVSEQASVDLKIVTEKVVALREATSMALHQIMRTRTMFRDGGDAERNSGYKRMRGIDTQAFSENQQPPIPVG